LWLRSREGSSLSGRQIERRSVPWTLNLVVEDISFGKRSFSVTAAIRQGKDIGT
jgi:hypothetical protein